MFLMVMLSCQWVSSFNHYHYVIIIINIILENPTSSKKEITSVWVPSRRSVALLSSSFTLLVDDNGKIVRWEVVVRMVLVMTKHLFSLLINGEKGIVLHQPHCRHSAAVFIKKDWNRVGLD